MDTIFQKLPFSKSHFSETPPAEYDYVIHLHSKILKICRKCFEKSINKRTFCTRTFGWGFVHCVYISKGSNYFPGGKSQAKIFYCLLNLKPSSNLKSNLKLEKVPWEAHIPRLVAAPPPRPSLPPPTTTQHMHTPWHWKYPYTLTSWSPDML